MSSSCLVDPGFPWQPQHSEPAHRPAGGSPNHYHPAGGSISHSLFAWCRTSQVRTVAVAAAMAVCAGCTCARWTGPGGETLSLIRVGLDTKIGRVEANVRNGTVAAEDYDAQAKLAETIRLLVEGMK